MPRITETLTAAEIREQVLTDPEFVRKLSDDDLNAVLQLFEIDPAEADGMMDRLLDFDSARRRHDDSAAR